jgi:hypothetical protein
MNFNPPFKEQTRDEEKGYLESLVEDLEQELKDIKERLSKLSKNEE